MAQYAVDSERTERAATAVTNPAPLGLSAFALTTFVLSAANAQWFTGSEIVIGLALFYGGLGQLLAGMWEFRMGNTFGGTAFTSYGSFWMAVAVMLQFKLIPNDLALGFFFLGWAIFTGMMFLGTLRSTLALMGVFLFLFLTFLALALGALLGIGALTVLGGYLGILTALIAWYTALAGLLSTVNSPFGLPVGPRV
ncbi:MAG TPA: acetate uptake transporter [Dictyobacter sp.]|jgi:succinate-acetate transporter protein|nr:acetate uptake transporter [Dictyobacter sp.]